MKYKPDIGSTDSDVKIIPLGEKGWSVRFWPGGVSDTGDCYFDFLKDGIVTNIPEHWRITIIPQPGDFLPFGHEMYSVEKGFEAMYIMPGEERFYAAQGAHHRIKFSEEEGPALVFVAPQYKEAKPVVIPGRAVAEGLCVCSFEW